MKNNTILVKGIQDNWTLQEILNETAVAEQAQRQAGGIKRQLEKTQE